MPSHPPLAPLDTEQLAEVERLGALQFALPEVELILAVEVDWSDGSEPWTAYHRGRLRAEAEIRGAIRRSALQGSAPAQKQFAELASRVGKIRGRR